MPTNKSTDLSHSKRYLTYSDKQHSWDIMFEGVKRATVRLKYDKNGVSCMGNTLLSVSFFFGQLQEGYACMLAYILYNCLELQILCCIIYIYIYIYRYI